MRKLIRVVLLAGSVAFIGIDGIASERMENGRRVYMESCARCHDSGADGAPVTGRNKEWVNRSHLWAAVLFEHANQGYMRMPGKAGKQDLSEYDVNTAAEYMLNLSYPDLPTD